MWLSFVQFLTGVPMTSEMAFECLFISKDAELLRTISGVLQELSICVEVCFRTGKAFDILQKLQTDLVVIDWEGEESRDLLESIWRSKKRKRPVVVAISLHEMPIPGAHIVMNKPVSQQEARNSFKTAYRMMLIDHRKTVRHALMARISATLEDGRKIQAIITDLGDGGAGLCCTEELMVGDCLRLKLPLPGASREVLVHARIVWTREGRAGCEFVRIPPVDLMILNDWLKSRSIVKKPLVAV